MLVISILKVIGGSKWRLDVLLETVEVVDIVHEPDVKGMVEESIVSAALLCSVSRLSTAGADSPRISSPDSIFVDTVSTSPCTHCGRKGEIREIDKYGTYWETSGRERG